MDATDSTTVEMTDAAVLWRRQRQLLLFPPARPLVERFGVEFFRSLPESPGVYFMCGEMEGVLYVGKARNLRRRLGSYRSANTARVPRKIRRLLAAVNRIYWDECRDETEAIAREREMLRTLRPKFNTAGTYPPARHHLGWQRSGQSLLIGIGHDTNDWEHRHGEFTRIKPVYASLLRLVWRALHSSAPMHDMPSRLLCDAPPPVYRFASSQPTEVRLVNLVVQRLEGFLCGEESGLPDWLANLANGGSRFEDQWRENDVVCLRDFFERQFGSEENHQEGRVS